MFGFFKKQKWLSPNYNERVQLSSTRPEPSMIILHYTGMETAVQALQRLCDEACEVSVHYVIEKNGKFHQLVDDDKRAWHAGLSYWEGLTDINSASIGIEIVNKGHEFGYEDFPQSQIKSLIGVLEKLTKTYAIPASHILGHSDIAPGRKIDPGEKFPWEMLSHSGFGFWPKPQEMDYQAAEDLILNETAVLELLVSYGYNPETEFEILVQEFHRHFYPEKFKESDNPKTLDVASIAKLLSLIRQKHETHN